MNIETVLGEDIITPLFDVVFKFIHPAIGVVDQTAYVGIWILCKIQDPDGHMEYKDLLFLITDKKIRNPSSLTMKFSGNETGV